MTATISTVQAMLKQQLEPTIQSQINWVDVLLEEGISENGQNKPGVRKMENNKFEIVSQNGGMTAYAGSETASLIASDISLEKMYITPKYVRASFRIGHPTLQATLSDKASLERTVDLYGMSIRRAMLQKKGRDLRGNGTGIVGVLPAGVQTSATITISGKAAGTVVSQARYGLGALQVFQPGAKISVGTAAQFAAGTQTDATVSTVNSETSITLTGSVTIGTASGTNNRGGDNSDTWYIRLTGEYGNSPMGLLGLIDDGVLEPGITTIQSLTRSTTPYMKSFCNNPSDASAIVADFRNLYSDVRRFNPNVKFFVVSQDVFAKYTDSITVTIQAQQPAQAYTSKLGTGHTGLMFAYGDKPLPIIMDTLLPYGTVLLIDPEQYFIADLFADAYVEDGVMVRVPGTTDYETARAAYYEIGTFSSRKLGGKIQYQSV